MTVGMIYTASNIEVKHEMKEHNLKYMSTK